LFFYSGVAVRRRKRYLLAKERLLMRHAFNYVLFHKPYGVLSQFTPEKGRRGLREFPRLPPGVYPVGRLDADSEGLLLLTDDNALKHRMTSPRYRHPRTYLVQVDQIPDAEALERLRHGILLDGRPTLPAGVRLLDSPPGVADRVPPIRFRKNVPTSWLEITLHEGRNRQVRRMTAAAVHPTLRLVRVALGEIGLGRLGPGEERVLRPHEVGRLRSSLGLPATPRYPREAGARGAAAGPLRRGKV